MTNPEVSIITANYNCEKFIKDTIESIQAQVFTNWELIIVDDNSKDLSVEIINTYIKDDERIQLLCNQENLGAAKTRNRAIDIARGRFIAFLDSDDLWKPNKLEKQLAFMKRENIPFSYSSYDLIDEDNNPMGKFEVKGKVSYSNLLKTCDIGCLTAIYDTKSLGKVNMPDILRRQDFGLWLRLLKKTDYAYALEDNLAIYRLRKSSISSNKRKAAAYQWKIYRDVEKLNLISSAYYFFNYAMNGILKYRS